MWGDDLLGDVGLAYALRVGAVKPNDERIVSQDGATQRAGTQRRAARPRA
jgi:hypothetical protein